MQLRNLTIPYAQPAVFAPMAGFTDAACRHLMADHGAAWTVSEMASAKAITFGDDKSMRLLRDKASHGIYAVQLFGAEPETMAQAIRIIQEKGVQFDILDINMGCPAPKVTGGLSGAALMRDLDHALTLVEAVVAAVPDLPVTLKMRLGWDPDCLNAPELAARAAGAGVRMLTVHGRTRAQFYSGRADWTAIRAVANLPGRPPLVANGDVVDAASARAALAQSGADAVMVGRGAQGAPWRLAQIAHELWGTPAPHVPQGAALADAVAEHYEDILSLYGQELGLRVARKHLGWYAEANGAANRAELMRAASPAATLAAIRAGFRDAGVPAAVSP